MTLNLAKTRVGTTLVELLVVMTVGAILMNVAFTLFIAQRRLVLAGMKSGDSLVRLDAVGRDFRTDVLEAVGVLDRHGEYRTGDDTLVLERADGERRVYVFDDGTLNVLTFKGHALVSRRVVAAALSEVRFSCRRDPSGRVRLVAMAVEAESPRRNLARLGGRTFEACLRCDE